MMSNETKLVFSGKEQELVCDTGWILTKQIIIEKIVQLFSGLLQDMQQLTAAKKSILPGQLFLKDPKISRGENYLGLPYVMLDYPRYFSKQNTLAIRTFFWWGNFFSISLQLSGDIKSSAAPVLLKNFLLLQQNDYWVCISSNPWEHHFEKDNFVPAQQLTEAMFADILYREGFMKISKKISVEQWSSADFFIRHNFEEMLLLLQASVT
jgi:hypothetical protein